MDTFTFTLSTGSVSVFFHEKLTVPSLPVSGGIYIADSNTVELLKKANGFLPSSPIVVIEAGEEHKTLANVERILHTALSLNLARDSLFVGFGGGVITDMTAFASSLYMRGAQLELVPTTLLAMADAAIGGKTGVDFDNFKNCVGTFYPASTVHIAVPVLMSLSESEYRSGLAEVFKTALLYAPKLYQILADRREDILSRNEELLLEVVKRCVQAKAHVVERDLKETGERMYLNLGHTFGHALESVAGFGTITHGEAIAWGISRALELGKMLGITDSEYVRDVLFLLEAYGWSSEPIHPVIASRVEKGNMSREEAASTILAAMKNDKKKKSGNIRFVLQREINSTLVTEVSDKDVLAVLG